MKSQVIFLILINSNSKHPTNLNQIGDKRLASVKFSASDVGKVIQNLNSNQAHGHDNISIWKLNILGDTINIFLALICKLALIPITYPSSINRILKLIFHI